MLTRSFCILILLLGLTACATQPHTQSSEGANLREERSRLSSTTPVRLVLQLQTQIEQFSAGDVRRKPLESQCRWHMLTPEWHEYLKLTERLKAFGATPDPEVTEIAAADREAMQARHLALRQSAGRYRPTIPLDPLTFPRIDGSTSTQPLSAVIASRILGVDYEWVYPRRWGRYSPFSAEYDAMVAGQGIPVASIRACATAPGQVRPAEIIETLIAVNAGTHQSYVNLIEGACDLTLTVRKPSADEANLARQRGVILEMQPIAFDALVFMVNRSNPVTSLTTEQIRSAYAGRFESWTEIGGARGPIRTVVRQPNSGSRELFEELVRGTTDVRENNEEKRTKKWLALSMSGPFDIVSHDSGAIGYSVHYYEQFMAISPQSRAVAIDGVLPSFSTISSRQYPYVFPIYVVYRKGTNADSPALRLANWLKTEEGQTIIHESGYVPLAGSKPAER